MDMQDRMSADPMRDDLLILVDALDRQLGTTTKEQAHRDGLLHRALSVVLWREGEDGPELLLARRASGKYHSAGLWANSCCSHPRVGEEVCDAAVRRVREELGCIAVEPREVGCFVYRAPFGDGLVEYEYDHVFIARCAGEVQPNPFEADAVRWEQAEDVVAELTSRPELFCAWAPNVFSLAIQALSETNCL